MTSRWISTHDQVVCRLIITLGPSHQSVRSSIGATSVFFDNHELTTCSIAISLYRRQVRNKSIDIITFHLAPLPTHPPVTWAVAKCFPTTRQRHCAEPARQRRLARWRRSLHRRGSGLSWRLMPPSVQIDKQIQDSTASHDMRDSWHNSTFSVGGQLISSGE